MRFRNPVSLSCTLFIALVLSTATPCAAQATNPCGGVPAAVCDPVLLQNQQLSSQDKAHLLAILNYTSDKPSLRDHVLELLKDPQDFDTSPVGDGNFYVNVPVNIPCREGDCGTGQQTIISNGISTKLSGLYRGVVFAGDRLQQLSLYRRAYNRLPPGFNVNGVYPPAPSSLNFADLETIQYALSLIGDAWESIILQLPPPNTPPSTVDCDGEVGTTPTHDRYGDRSGNNLCEPGAFGLYRNLTDQEFPLRKYLTCIKNQGQRGTCHTFAATSAFELMVSMNHGIKANFSEQDLMEHYRLLWSPGWEHESGDSWELLTDAISNNYYFAYEKSWEYNPSLSQTFDANTGVFVNACQDYPSTQPGCSDSAPQAPGRCTGFNLRGVPFPVCALHDAGVPESKYRPTALTPFWNINNVELSKEYMILSIAFNDAVLFGLNITPNFKKGGNGGYVVYNSDDISVNAGSHFVHVVGLATNDNLPKGAPQAHGGGYFIVKNSWNNCTGDGGYLYLDWDYVKAVGLEAFSLSGVN